MEDVKLLQDLRERVLDEDQSTASALRVCVMLGAQTSSTLLRDWASRELRGYGPDDDLPDYRRIDHPPLFMDSVSGSQMAKNQLISPLQVPSDLREYIPDALLLRQPIDELERAARSGDGGFKLMNPVFPYVASQWSQQLSTFQMVERLYYVIADAELHGIVGRVRTALVEMVADLTESTPFDRLPETRRVDAAVQIRMYGGDHNEIHAPDNSGAVGAGRKSKQKVNNGILPDEVADLFRDMRGVLSDIDDTDDRATVEQAIDDLEAAVTEDNPDPENVRRRGRLLAKLAEVAGTAAITTGANGVVEAVLNAGLGG